MRYRTFGRLGWQVSEIGFGAWAIGGGWGAQSDDDSVAALHRAFELGCNFVDTAQNYGNGHSERVIARALREWRGAGRIRVATKIPPLPGMWPPSPYDRIEARYPEKHLRERLERSLRELGTECIDLVQLHTWTRAWNRDPTALDVLAKFKREGKILAIGVSTPEQDQNALIDLMRAGKVDAVQVVYNIFEQEPQAEFFPVAAETRTGVIVRVALDESALAGRLTAETRFEEGDVRNRFFAGDRLARTVERVAKIRAMVGGREPDMAIAALKFALLPPAVSTVIPGIRSITQAERNMAVGSMPPMEAGLALELREHQWRRSFWYSGK